jgi:hypothetical protein
MLRPAVLTFKLVPLRPDRTIFLYIDGAIRQTLWIRENRRIRRTWNQRFGSLNDRGVLMPNYRHTNPASHSILFALVCAVAATNASAVRYPTEHRYLTKPLQICDQGIFYVGGAPKVTPFGGGATPGANTQIIIGSMFVHFQVPMKTKSWPLIIVHGSGYTGSCVEGTAAGSEGWMDYTVRHGIPTYVVDQAGRGRSGFDKSVIHEGKYLIQTNPAAATALLPTFGGSTSTAWTSWFGSINPAGTDVTDGQMVRFGAPALQSNGLPAPGIDPLCATRPARCTFLGHIPMEPEAPYAVDQAIASRTGIAAPAGLGTVKPDVDGHVNPAFPENDRYLALEAYKFNVPNTESTLPGSICPSCTPTLLNATNTWTPRALATLVEGLGGAIVATHSQSGQIGMNMVRVLREDGKLDMLKGLIQVEGGSGTAASGTTAADFQNVPYLAFKGYYSATSTAAQTLVAEIKALGGTADYIQLDQPGFWQGDYQGPYGFDYVGPFKGVSHMMMIETTNLKVMDVILEWAGQNIKQPEPKMCPEDAADD